MVAVVLLGNLPNSTKVEGRCLPDGWRLLRPWKFPGPHRGSMNPRGWPNSREGGLGPRAGEGYHGREMVRKGRWARGPARAGPLPTKGVSPCMAEWDDPREGRETPRGPGGPSDPRGRSFTVEGWCLGLSPDQENSGPLGVPVNPAWLPREGWAPGRVGIPGLLKRLRQGRGAEEARPGPAPFPHPWGYPRVWQTSEMTGPGGREAWDGRDPRETRDPRGGRAFTVRGCQADVPGLASVTRKGRWSRALGHLPHTFRPVTVHKNSSSLGS